MNEDWREDALCRQVAPELFFPAKGDSAHEAKQVCQLCPVRLDCLEYSLVTGQRYGIWGGCGEWERRKIRKQRQLDAPAAAPAGRSVTADEARHLLSFGLAMSDVAKKLGVSQEWIRQLLGNGKRAAA